MEYLHKQARHFYKNIYNIEMTKIIGRNVGWSSSVLLQCCVTNLFSGLSKN